jgi:hypothetical protein
VIELVISKPTASLRRNDIAVDQPRAQSPISDHKAVLALILILLS